MIVQHALHSPQERSAIGNDIFVMVLSPRCETAH
jgi:hypothetical protein